MFSANCAKVAKDHLRNDEHNELYWSILTMSVSCRYEAKYPAAMKQRLVLLERQLQKRIVCDITACF
jgi:hypothetical protein